ncbi:MAG TPA: UPF0758 domain-containing protein [Anaerolineales bacterium]|nr:UPF0758 domain-containing protein [Anaerolineales bacterium]
MISPLGRRDGWKGKDEAGTRGQEFVAGHRERLRARYRLSGEAGLQDYELLELLLTYAIPRRDMKLLAKKLLERFGTLARVLGSELATLEEIDGIGAQAATLISLIRPLAVRFLTAAPSAKTVLKSTGEAAATVSVRFLDHLIIGDSTPYSFKANRLL